MHIPVVSSVSPIVIPKRMLPEWAPNLHPLIVHFPLALLFVAVGADVLSFVVRRWTWLRPAALGLYVLGAISAVLTYVTGNWAADSVRVPAEVEALLTEHADLAWWTMLFFATYALVRLGAATYDKTRDRTAVHGALCAVALVGLYILWETGEHGAQMVYQYGVGVATAQASEASASQMQEPEAAGFVRSEQGWTWTPRTPAAWTQHTQWMGNPSGELRTRLVDLPGGAQALSLRMERRGDLMFVVPDTLGDVQVEATLDPSAFDGTLMLVHHVQDAQTYDFLALTDSTMQLGRMEQGQRTVLDEGTVDASGWITVRATGDGDHFRGYVNDEMIAHGHGSPLAPGRVGLRLEGSGPVLLQRMQARAVGE